MDTLKTCMTNVHSIPGIDTTRLLLYHCEEPAVSAAEHVSNTAAGLRQYGCMCAAVHDRLWVFEQGGETSAEKVEAGFRLELQSTIAEQSQLADSDGRPAFDVFLGALEESFSYVLLSAYRALKISTFTWLLRENELHDSGILVRLQHQLSGDRKQLSIATSVWTSMGPRDVDSDRVQPQKLILAPSGTAAALEVPEDPATRIGTKREDRDSAYQTEQWKSLVRRSLLKEGIQLEDDTSWLAVIPHGSQVRVCWPRSLCFSPLDGHKAGLRPEKDLFGWNRWFRCAAVDQSEDPLSFAEGWSSTFAEREHMVSRDTSGEEHDSNLDNRLDVNGMADATTSAFDVTSPPLTNRPDLQALHGIYPTPPDGLANHTAMQPHSDSLPVPVPNSDTVNHLTSIPSDPPQESSTSLLDDVAQNVEGDPLQRNHSIASSVGLQGQTWNRGSSDDLFGDMDDLEYGRDEVGDADFSFFDEPDDVPSKPDVEMQNGTDTTVLSEDQSLAAQATESGLAIERESGAESHTYDRKQDSIEVTFANPSTERGVSSEDVDVSHTENSSALDQEAHHSPPMLAAQFEDSANTRPLSPFGIREALLPPPIPASASQPRSAGGAERSSRRSSFGPLAFNMNGSASLNPLAQVYSDFNAEEGPSSYYLAPTKVPYSTSAISPRTITTSSSLADSISDDEDNDGVESDSLSEAPDVLSNADIKTEEPMTTTTKKRKRTLDTFAYCGPQLGHNQRTGRTERRDQKNIPADLLEGELQGVLSMILNKDRSKATDHDVAATHASARTQASGVEMSTEEKAAAPTPSTSGISVQLQTPTSSEPVLPNVLLTFPVLKANDLVLISQITSEQAVTVTGSIARELNALSIPHTDSANYQQMILSPIVETFKTVVPTTIIYDVPSLALVREPLPVQRAQPNPPNPGTATQARHPPRPPPRLDPTTLGPDILPLGASFIRALRGEEVWEMAPTALNFWEALGLGPIAGAKNIRHFCLAPDGEMLNLSLTSFMHSLKANYEACKFGSMAVGTEAADKAPPNAVDIAAITPVTLDDTAEVTAMSALQAYWHACALLGTELAALAFDEPGRTLVVSMVDPFSSTSHENSHIFNQHLSACFLNMSRAYRSAVTQNSKKNGKTSSLPALSDIDFKILPVSLVSSATSLVVPTAQQMTLLAREYYDRSPPPSEAIQDPSVMLNVTAPSVELVAPLPKRINFQLIPDPPTDLLHEASILHVAYATSEDGKWANVAWHDNTGRHASSGAFCLQGRTFADVALEVWQRTVELIQAREVIWRIFIVTTGSDGIEASQALCWKEIIKKATERKQYLSVSLLHFQPNVALNVLPPSDAATQPGQGTLSAGPTPVTTPQPGSGPGGPITSPDAVSAGQATLTAPPTPAPSETASNVLEADPDAHLVDAEDETWGMLIDQDVAATLRPRLQWPVQTIIKHTHADAQAHAVLIKRGKLDSSDCHSNEPGPYPCAGASLVWTLRVRPKSARQAGAEKDGVDEGSVRHAEVMLREVLGMFRNLGILSRVKGLDPSGLTPVHIITAARGAEGLDGLLPAQLGR